MESASASGARQPASAAALPLIPPSGGAGAQPGQVLRYCDFRDFIQHLGIDPRSDASGLVMVAAHQMFSAVLPAHWTEHIDESSSRVYFFDGLTGDSLWIHPQEDLFRELIEEVRSWHPEEPLNRIFERSNAHLKNAYAQATEAIAQWSGPYDAPQGPEEAPERGSGDEAPIEAATQFYYNNATAESRWSDPLETYEHDLRQRHSILCECMSAHQQNLAKMSPSATERSAEDSSGEEWDTRNSESMQAFMQNLWGTLGDLRLPQRVGHGECSPPPTLAALQRPSYLPEGNDTVRSSMSYLTARSTTSCNEEARTPDIDGLDNHPFVLRPAPD